MTLVKTTSLKLDLDLKVRIDRLAKSRRRSAHWIMREAVAGYVEREEKRQAFIKEGLDSLRHYKETGLHVTLEEVEKWLESWGTDNELEAPECHK